MAGKSEVIACSFCGIDRMKVKKLIAGPRVFICCECVELAAQIVAVDHGDKPEAIARLTSALAEAREVARQLRLKIQTIAKVAAEAELGGAG